VRLLWSYCIVSRIGAKLKAELEGNVEQVTCIEMNKLYRLCVNGPNACEIAFFTITFDIGTVALCIKPIATSLRQTGSTSKLQLTFGTVGFPNLSWRML